MIALMLIAPFAWAALAAALIGPAAGPAAATLAACGGFAASWACALGVASTGEARAAAMLSLATGCAAVAAASAFAGGAASPLVLLAVILPLEAWWVSRDRHWAIAAAAVGVAGVACGALLPPIGPAVPQAWHWLAPGLYGLAAALRRNSGGETEETERAAPLEHALDAAVLRMSPGGDVAAASPKSSSVLGVPTELLLASGLFERVHVADRVAYLFALADMRDGAASRRADVRIRLPQDDPRILADNYRPFEIEFARTADEPGMVAVIRTNDAGAGLKQALSDALEAADRIDVTKSRFLAAVSHELRTPLNAIIGFSDMMLQEMCGAFGDARQREYVGLIRESGQHLLGVVNSILDVSKIESGAYAIAPEPFRFREAMDMCRGMMRLQAEAKKVELSVQTAASVGEVNADRRAVQQILINLVSNAIKFTPSGGSVTVGASRIGSRVHFWVNDTGIGVAEEDLARIGKPFMQVQNDYTRRFEGTGLGLALVKGLVALHQGTMTIESAPGQGTMVSVSLPVSGPSQAMRLDLVEAGRVDDAAGTEKALLKAS